MEYEIYKYCAIIGCTLVGLQVALQAFGVLGDTDVGGHDAGSDVHHDVSPEGHGNALVGILSFKALTAFAGIFGLVGMITLKRELALGTRVAVSVAAGVVGMFAIAWMMRSLHRLQSSGSIDVRNAIGQTGRVYLRVPGQRSGHGKVTVEIQGRSMEFVAVTDGEVLETGASVTVAAVEGNGVLKVVSV